MEARLLAVRLEQRRLTQTVMELRARIESLQIREREPLAATAGQETEAGASEAQSQDAERGAPETQNQNAEVGPSPTEGVDAERRGVYRSYAGDGETR